MEGKNKTILCHFVGAKEYNVSEVFTYNRNKEKIICDCLKKLIDNGWEVHYFTEDMIIRNDKLKAEKVIEYNDDLVDSMADAILYAISK